MTVLTVWGLLSDTSDGLLFVEVEREKIEFSCLQYWNQYGKRVLHWFIVDETY